MGGKVFFFLKLPESVIEVIKSRTCASLSGGVTWSLCLLVIILSCSSLEKSKYCTSVSISQMSLQLGSHNAIWHISQYNNKQHVHEDHLITAVVYGC